MTVDLHVHTTCSDGLRTPEQTVMEAISKEMKAISITDHDTTAGIQRAMNASLDLQLEVIPGVEINSFCGNMEIHILGYYIDEANCNLQNKLSIIRESRDERALTIIKRLQNLAYNISIEEVRDFVGEGAIGRPHIARMLVRKRYFRNTNDAFINLLVPGKEAYVDRYRMDCKEAIDLIVNANGIPVIAHPGIYKEEINWSLLTAYGLQGIEVFHSKHDYKTSMKYSKIAIEYGLIQTGGSDCHGIGTSSILDSLELSYDILEDLKRLKIFKEKRGGEVVKR